MKLTLKQIFNELPNPPAVPTKHSALAEYDYRIAYKRYKKEFSQRIQDRALIMANLIHQFRIEVRKVTGRAPSYLQAGHEVRRQIAAA